MSDPPRRSVPPAVQRAVQRTAVVAPPRRIRFPRSRHLTALPSPVDPPDRPALGDVLRCGDLLLDIPAHQAFVGATALALSHLQFVLLVHLVRNAERVVSADELAGVAATVGPVRGRTVASAVSRLRRHLGSGPQRPSIALSRARGYQLIKPPAHLVGL